MDKNKSTKREIGDTPANSHFARHAVKLIDMVLSKDKPIKKPNLVKKNKN